MIGFVMVGANDLESSAKFYDTILKTVGMVKIYSDEKRIGYGENNESDIEFYITIPANKEAATYGNGTQISFLVKTRAEVDKFHEIAIANDAKNEGLPGVRPAGATEYYAYIRDPDGNKICAYTNSEN